MTNLDSILKNRDITFPTKVCIVKAMVFPVVMYGYDSWTIKKAEALKNWCFWTVVFEKTLESPLDSKEIQPFYPKGNQSWIFIRRTDAEAEAPILWAPDGNNWLNGKDLNAGEDWRQEEKGMTEEEMVSWHHQLKGHEFEQALGDGEGQGSLACCSPWGCKESDMTVQLNNNNVFSNVGNKVWKIQSSEDLGFMDELHTPIKSWDLINIFRTFKNGRLHIIFKNTCQNISILAISS